MLVDVRKLPGSRSNPQFNQDTLPLAFEKAGICYTSICRRSEDLHRRRLKLTKRHRTKCFFDGRRGSLTLTWERIAMASLLQNNPASGGPGIEPRWTRSDKDGVGTAYSALSRVWFTVSKGILNEVYYPTVDRPQIRDLQYLITDGETFFRDERHLNNLHECVAPDALGYHITNSDPEGRFRIIKEVIADPHQSCVLVHTRLEADADMLAKLRLFVLLAPHLEVGGRGNNGNIVETNWGKVLAVHKDGTWLVLAASVPFLRCSCGYVGTTDGWQDLASNFQMDWEFDSCARRQHRPDRRARYPAEPGVCVGAWASATASTTPWSRWPRHWVHPFAAHRTRLHRAVAAGRSPHVARREGTSVRRRRSFSTTVSHSLILAHEDKKYDGALIASLSIPWGEYASDDNLGGYHLVWTRDMCHSAIALLAAGSPEVPLRALIYLACAQKEDGGFYQNFWINGEPYWHGTQLDETAFPILLAWHLHQAKALQDFDPYSDGAESGRLSHRAWAGNSPRTMGGKQRLLAIDIGRADCRTDLCRGLARERGQQATAQYLEEYADFLESHIESWTVTTEGSLVPDIRRHFIRIHPADRQQSPAR